MLRTTKSLRSDERGAVLLTVSMFLVAMLGVCALVIDLGAVRLNRSTSRNAADAAATAGAIAAAGGDGRAGCEAALDYLELNLPEVTSFDGSDCLSFPTVCDDSTISASTTGADGDWIATIVYPVPDDSPYLDPSAIGAEGQAISSDDGGQCDRLAVSVASTHEYLFASALGATDDTTEVSSVARTDTPVGSDFAINLLVLERYECGAISASGSGGGDGGILVDAVFNPTTGELDPGYIAVDSDGSVNCSGNGVLDVDGANSFIRADGPAGCDSELGTYVGAGGQLAGEGCGDTRVLAPGTPGCNFPACTSSGTVAPDPISLGERVTRAPVDHRYNCKASYPFPSGWEIEACADTPAPYIDDLVDDYGVSGTTPPGFNTWSGAGYPCTVSGAPGTTLVVPSGDWRVDCDRFTVNRTVIFQGGDVIFDGDVSIESSGVLAINSRPCGGFPYHSASDAAIVYVRDGEVGKSGQGSLILYDTAVYFSETSGLSMTGGAGALIWDAPTSGNFEDLAMWSESTASNQLSGQATLELEGVFFAPWANLTYQGNGSQQQAEAQFIARSLSVTGQGVLVVQPSFSRSVLFPATLQTTLIR